MLVRVIQNLVVESSMGINRVEVARVNMLNPHICGAGLKLVELEKKVLKLTNRKQLSEKKP